MAPTRREHQISLIIGNKASGCPSMGCTDHWPTKAGSAHGMLVTLEMGPNEAAHCRCGGGHSFEIQQLAPNYLNN